jgi:hypothetical protein
MPTIAAAIADLDGTVPAKRPNDTIREIAKALRRHVDAVTLEKVVNESSAAGAKMKRG